MAKEWPDTHKDKELSDYKKMNANRPREHNGFVWCLGDICRSGLAWVNER